MHMRTCTEPRRPGHRDFLLVPLLPPRITRSTSHHHHHQQAAAAMARTPFGLAVAAALIFAVVMPAAAQAPAPAPTSDGTSIDQGIAYLLMIVALVLTYLIHPLDASSPYKLF